MNSIMIMSITDSKMVTISSSSCSSSSNIMSIQYYLIIIIIIHSINIISVGYKQ